MATQGRHLKHAFYVISKYYSVIFADGLLWTGALLSRSFRSCFFSLFFGFDCVRWILRRDYLFCIYYRTDIIYRAGTYKEHAKKQ